MISIRKSETADTRTCDFTKVSRETLLASSIQHVGDVHQALAFFAGEIVRAAGRHDYDKLSDIDGFHRDFKTGFAQTELKAIASSASTLSGISTGRRSGTQWFNDGPRTPDSLASMGGKSSARKAASAHIAKIPFVLASHIARVYHPALNETFWRAWTTGRSELHRLTAGTDTKGSERP